MESISRAERRSVEIGPATYLAVWLALIVLAVATWLLAKVHLPSPWGIGAALLIATVKGSLVVLYFMHLRAHRGASRLSLAVAVSFLVVLTALTVADVYARFPVTNPPESQPAREHLAEPPPRPWTGEQRQEPGSQPHYLAP